MGNNNLFGIMAATFWRNGGEIPEENTGACGS